MILRSSSFSPIRIRFRLYPLTLVTPLVDLPVSIFHVRHVLVVVTYDVLSFSIHMKLTNISFFLDDTLLETFVFITTRESVVLLSQSLYKRILITHDFSIRES